MGQQLLFLSMILFAFVGVCESQISSQDDDTFVEYSMNFIDVKKCCPEDEMMVEVTNMDGAKAECQPIADGRDNSSVQWVPDFVDNQGQTRPFVEFHNVSSEDEASPVLCASQSGPCVSVLVGKPQCGPMRAWPVFTYVNYHEDLKIRPYGVLRHVTHYDNTAVNHEYSLQEYCVDAVRLQENSHKGHAFHRNPSNPSPDPAGPTFFALICAPGPWDESNYFEWFVRVAYPIGLGIGLLVLIAMVTVHLMLKELRDLSGCMLISLILSLIMSMAGNLTLAATDARPSPHANFFIIESVVHSCDVAVHFWLNAIGHRAWNAVRYPRKEAMRPEGKRYMLYSLYAWGLAASVLALALVVHFLIDRHQPLVSPHSFFTWYQIGWLALALFCSTCVFLLLVNVYFYTTTRIRISQQTAYGRTFHRNKGYYQAFTRLFIIIDSVWIIQTLSWLQFPVLVGLRIIADVALPFLILWASMKGRRVMHLLKIRFQASHCWPCRRWGSSRQPAARHHPTATYFGEEMIALGTPI